jgi:hypothetical protein
VVKLITWDQILQVYIKYTPYLQILRKLYANCLSFTLLLHGMGTILPAEREITPIKSLNLIIKLGLCKKSILSLLKNCMVYSLDFVLKWTLLSALKGNNSYK